MASSSVTTADRDLFIGTAGWSIPKLNADRFPSAGSHLERYATVFSTAEINTSFYRPHRRSTYERWAAAVPEAFRFAVKAPKSVSHSDWSDMDGNLRAFFAEIDGLGQKLGAVLLQLPPKRHFDPIEADRFLRDVRSRSDVDMALEPRHPSWFTGPADTLLQVHRIARVAADPPPAPGADRPGGYPSVTYMRLHGSPTIYRSPYGTERLTHLARDLRTSTSRTWCVFDNTASYAATGDALALQALMD